MACGRGEPLRLRDAREPGLDPATPAAYHASGTASIHGRVSGEGAGE